MKRGRMKGGNESGDVPVMLTVRAPTSRPRNAFDRSVHGAADDPVLRGLTVSTVQVNVGLRCNLACRHCHVESGPKRIEEMSWETMTHVLAAASLANARTIDVTGGAPEMNPHFRRFVAAARAAGHDVIVRTNLTILLQKGYDDLPGFYAGHGVRLVASLPCYLENNVDKQRGRGVYHDSIEVIRRLNDVGYGVDPRLSLDLVFNPGGPALPPRQAALQDDYRRELADRYGIRFDRLICITNVPIGRFLHDLARDGRAEAYHELLRHSFNPDTLDGLMCRHQLHVAYDGRTYDCDFNYALHLTAEPAAGPHVSDFDPVRWLARRVATANHCFACTAGAGSSCGGEVV